MDLLIKSLNWLNGLLTAGIAITALSLLMYALSFNLRDRITRTLAIILLCVVVVFGCEALSSVTDAPEQLDFWLRLQWIGIIYLPAAYMQFSDALLATTGRPSRYRRRWAVRILYALSTVFLLLLPTNRFVGPLVANAGPAPHLQRTWLTWLFAGYYVLAMLLAWVNFVRAYRRAVTSATRRRINYLMVGALAPVLGSYPYLLFGPGIAARLPLIFWLAVTVSNLLTSVFIILMAYAVAFFGVPWPDRVVKRRLFKWLLRGPVTASTVLAVTTTLRRVGTQMGVDLAPAVPAVMVGSILLMEHLITLVSPALERRLLLFGKERDEMDLLQTLDERLLTLGDLQQFLESTLAAVCDRLQTKHGFAAVFGPQGVEIYLTIGGDVPLDEEELSSRLLEAVDENRESRDLLVWGDYWLVPLFDDEEHSKNLLGLIGARRQAEQNLDEEQLEALDILAERARLAIRDRSRQQQAFSSLEELTPQMDLIQRLRAASRYDGAQVLSTSGDDLQAGQLSPWVKDALTHYWGGPKLTQNPLLNLQIVQQTALDHEENPTNALRSVLRTAIENVRPEGERRFTADWLLYNILDMKFLEGRKVREIALRLAMSEADLYRKQRVAIEAVANAIAAMEQQARQGNQAEGAASNQPTTKKKTPREVEFNGDKTPLQ
ncbi:MAG: histidine kinase N-terminal 7TM domain-containing protein [Chloroflexota bacterium]